MNKEEIKEILEELENMYEISELEEQVNNINKIRNYIINLQKENQKYKEVIDKTNNWVRSYMDEWSINDEVWQELNELLILLEEVE